MALLAAQVQSTVVSHNEVDRLYYSSQVCLATDSLTQNKV